MILFMRIIWTILFFFIARTLSLAQPFSCDGAIHLIVYDDYEKETILYTLTVQDGYWEQKKTFLSEKRKLTALVYNVSDNFLYCLDSKSFEVIKIEKNGQLFSLGRPRNIDTTLIFHAATISPDGRGMMLISYSPNQEKNISFHNVNLSGQGGLGGAFGVTSAFPANVGDFATDPITGAIYGYDNKNKSLVTVGIGGAISSLTYPSTEVSDMDAVFFDREGQLYGYSPSRGLYKINKANGRIQYLERGPQGDYADGCSCPYTYEFTKEIIPSKILMCDTFEVEYFFKNRLGIAQAWITLEDSFPQDFEIVDIQSSIVIPKAEESLGSNALKLKNIIYLMGNNSIRIKVKSPYYFLGRFFSFARQYPFPKAYNEIQYPDDPLGEIVSVSNLTLNEYLDFNCSRDTAIFISPLKNATHLWNNFYSGEVFKTGDSGKVTLTSIGECEIFDGEFNLTQFPANPSVEILGENEILSGSVSDYQARWLNFEPILFQWIVNQDTISCSDCATIDFKLFNSSQIELILSDKNGCALKSIFPVKVGVSRKIFAPSGFSPNGDGINDFFNLYSEMEARADLIIYDRWGNLIFDKKQIPLNQPEEGWPGIGQNKGVFMWKAKIYFEDGEETFQQGEVILF